MDVVTDLTERIHRDFVYDPGFTTVTTPLDEVLDHRHGVCQDFAHLAVGCVRSMGLAARYVSGYLETAPPRAPSGWSARTRPTPGCRCSSPVGDGSTSTRPTTRSSATTT